MAIGNILVNVQANISDYERKMNKVAKITEMSISEATYAIQRTGGTIAAVGSTIAGTSTLLIGGATAIAANYEQAFTGVKKVLDGTPDQFDELSKAIRNMSKEIPMTTTEIAAIAEEAGKLGVGIDDVAKFTRTVADLGATTNMTATDASEAFARFANIMGMPLSEVDRLGSAVVHLGNNFATSEKDILNMGMRMAGVGRVIGMSEADVMSFATAISATGMRAEAGGSAFSRVANIINKAVGEGGESLEGFAKVAGVSADEFSNAFKTGPAEAMAMFVDGLAEIQEAGGNTAVVMDDLGIKGVYNHDLLNRLSGANDILRDAITKGNQGWEENTALADEANQRYGTFISRLKMLGNRLTDIALIFGNEFMGIFSKLMQEAEPLIAYLEKLAKKFEDASADTKKFIAIAAMLVPVVGAFMAFAGVAMIVVGKLIEAARVANVFFGSMKMGMSLIGGLSSSFLPLIATIGAVVLAIAGIGAILVWAYNEFEGFRTFVHETWAYIQESVSLAVTAIKDFVMDIMGQLLEFWNENGAAILEATTNVWNFIKGVIEAVMPVIATILQVAWIIIEQVIISVWNNIKGVIQGALDIIMGIVKIFTGLFTGDWTTMWEGIKQLFSGAVEFIWNLMQLMFWGKLIKGLGAFVGGFRSMLAGMWEFVKGLFTGSISAIKGVFTAGFNFIRNFGTTSMGGLRNIISMTWNLIKTVFLTVLKSIQTLVTTSFKNIVQAIRNKMGDAYNKVKEVFGDMISYVTGLPGKFMTMGKDLIQGLINGILDMGVAAVEAITGVVDGVINKAKSLLGIKSPSRVFKSIGSDTVEGYEVGVKSRKELAVKEVSNLFDKILTQVKSSTAKEREDIRKNAEEIKKIERRSAEDIQSIKAKAAKAKRKLTQDESIKIQRIQEDAAKKMRDLQAKNNKLELDMAGKQADELMKLAKEYVEDKRKNGKMSLADEVYFWNAMYTSAKVGSKQYEDALKNHQDAVKNMRTEVEKTMKEYNDKALAIEKDYLDKSKAIYDELNSTYEARLDQLYGFAGLFDNFEKKMELSGTDLVDNLANQVKALQEYGIVMDSLDKRIGNDALVEELRALGVKSLGELEALNALSDKELEKYVNLYQQKFNLAKNQTDKELEPLKDDVAERLEALRKETDKQLTDLSKEWISSINDIVNGTKKEFDSMRQVGLDAAKGLNEGLKSMNKELQNTANLLANTVLQGLKKAFDIHSPSKKTNAFGVFIGQGLANGISRSVNLVAAATRSLEDAAMPEVGKVKVGFATPDGADRTFRSAVRGTLDVNDGRDSDLVDAIDDLRRDLTDLTVQMDGQEVARLTNGYHERMDMRRTQFRGRTKGVTH